MSHEQHPHSKRKKRYSAVVFFMRPPVSLYIELTKPRIVSLVLVTTLLGYFLGAGTIYPSIGLTATMIGTALCCAGSGVLNQYLERDADLLMERTKRRPIPAGQISPAHALGFGVLLVLSGVSVLLSWANLLTAFLAILTAFLYVIVYTPLKRLTWLNTFIGAIPGALPPLGGWAAATGWAAFRWASLSRLTLTGCRPSGGATWAASPCAS
jgi:protoheme IX farnesyltransferase